MHQLQSLRNGNHGLFEFGNFGRAAPPQQRFSDLQHIRGTPVDDFGDHVCVPRDPSVLGGAGATVRGGIGGTARAGGGKLHVVAVAGELNDVIHFHIGQEIANLKDAGSAAQHC